MFVLSQIKQKYSEEIFRRNPKAVLVEYLQYELLDSIYKQAGSEHLSFMGGTAIRIIYNSSRFSEDLDFDNFFLSFREFKLLLDSAAIDMEIKGFKIEFRFVEKGAYHCYIKFPDLLFNNDLATHKNEKILIRVDTVQKKKLFKPEIKLLNGFDVYRKILVNPPSVILSQKLITILERKREKGRDFYDVSFLLGLAEPDYDFLKEERGINKSDLKKKLAEKISFLKIEKLAEDVLPLLINPGDQERILSFREYIEQKL